MTVTGATALAGKCFSVAVVFWLAVNSGQSLAFGVDGHRITVAIAEQHLSQKTAAALAQISDGKALEELALWPDQIRGAPKWSHTKPWHYINIKDQQRLHLAGDIHQPLHVGRYSDLGGNRIPIKWLGQNKRRNLHWVWDTGLIKVEGLDVHQYSALIDKSTPQQRRNWQSDSFLDWAKESKILRAQVYEFGQPARKGPITIDQHYIDRTKPLLKKRLLMAGIRLAGCLNRIFDSTHFAPLGADKNACETRENLE